MNKTQIKLIDAAEREFAEHGFHGASIRDITSRAGANIAAVNYHFGSKETLFIEMVRRRVEPINAIRFSRLDKALAESGGAPLEIREIVDILVRPMVEAYLQQKQDNDSGNKYFLRAMGRGMAEETQFMSALHQDILAELIKRFRFELSRSLADIPSHMIQLCFAYLGSTLSGVMLRKRRDDNDTSSIEFMDADHLVNFLTGGLQAVVSEHRNTVPQNSENAP
ncbi:transcriptional regulator, TetR family protein [Verrucomicrobiia bacterium DG1235]|nr:transcriptional regulator, TetR family protein [Verrucomicrobiae bacterium DG1235]